MKPTGITPVLLKGSVPDAAPLPETPLKQEHEPRRPSAQLRDLPSRKKASQAVGSEEPRSPVSRTRIVDAAQREFVAAQIYKAQVMYHATTSHSKESIQKGGFSAHRKSGGATAELMGQVAMSEQFNQNAKTHHYAFTDVENAKVNELENKSSHDSQTLAALQQKPPAQLTDADKGQLTALTSQHQSGTQALQAISDQYQDQFNAAQTKIQSDFTDQVKAAIAAVAKEKNLAVVFDANVAIYTSNDITDDVLKRLNK